MQLEGTDQADAELLELVLHKDASAELCLAALSAALKAPRCSALKSAADIVLERFAGDATVPLRLVQALLSASEEKVGHSTGSALLSLLDVTMQGIGGRHTFVYATFRHEEHSKRVHQCIHITHTPAIVML